MLRKLRRRIQRESHKRQHGHDVQKSALQLENLENRLLLDSSGYWTELGWRSGSGGGVTWDINTDQYESEMVISSDGDPIVFWVEGALDEYVPIYSGSSVEYFQAEGSIYARQYGGEDIGWWDMADGGASLGTGSQLAADSGPNDTIVLAWARGGAIEVSHWDGAAWASLGLETLGNAAQKPSIAISQLGEIFVSYTTVYPEPGSTNPNAGQREIVVQKYGFTYDTNMVGPPQVENMGWTEVHNADVGEFMQSANASTGGVSNDSGQSFDSAITVDQYGRPMVVWTDFTNSSNSEIFLKRWDGDSWEEMGLGSASDPDSDVNFGVSSDPTVSVQPDVAVAPNGDVIVTWVNWNNWADKTADGQAGIFVKTLPTGSNEWESYAVGSATGAGIAQDSTLPEGSMGQGWYFSPKIDIDSNGYPLICWQGYGVGERFSADRNGDLIVESPMSAVFVSHYDGTEFNVLHDTDNARGAANDPDFMAWMPAVATGNNDQFFMAYTWHDDVQDEHHLNDEIFAQVWDTASNSWKEFGRGSMSSGNDVFGGYPLGSLGAEQIQPQVALIDYSTSSSLDIVTAVPNLGGVNDGHVYLYNRLTGQWTTDVDTVEFGTDFDIKGEPETEYGVAGKPLLAYLDDVTGLPYVYEYLPGGWSLMEGDGTDGAVADVPGLLAEADPTVYNNAGLSVQAGPDGQVLLAYVKEVGASQLVTTYLWDPDLNDGSWTSMGNIPQLGGVQAVYYANFSGYDWDVDGNLSDGATNNNGRIYADEGAWYFWDQNNNGNQDWNLVNGEVFVGTGNPGDDNYVPGAGRQWITFNDQGEPIFHEGGILITAAYEDDESEIAETFVAGTVMHGEVDHQFRLIEDSHVIVQMMYDMDSLNVDEHLFLVLDGEVIDVDPTDSLAITPIDSIKAGEVLDYDTNGFFVFDSKIWAEASSPEESVLTAGLHTVGVRSLSEITMPNLKYGFPNEEPGPADPVVIDGWTVSPDGTEPAVTALSWGAAFGLTGANDGGIQMAFDDSQDPTTATPQKYTASFSQDIYLARGGDVRIQLDLEMAATGTLDSDDTLEFRVLIDGEPVTDASETAYLVTGDAGASNADIAYATITVDTANMADGLAVGTHTISLEGVYTDSTDNLSGAGATIKLDNVKVSKIDRLYDYLINDSFHVTPEAMGWLYADAADPGDTNVDGGYLAGANLGDATYGGGLAMILTESNTATPLEGAFLLNFEMGGPIKLSFDYQLDISDEVDVDEFLTLVVAIDGTLITSPVDTANLADDDPYKNLEYISLVATAPSAGGTGNQDTGTIEIELNDEQEIAALQALYSGGHQLVIQGILSNGADVDAGAGTGTVTIDNVNIVGTHQTHGRVDNFTVYQHVVPESYATGPDHDNFSADPLLVSAGANAADQWRFSEVDPDSIVQPLHETGVVRAEWDSTDEALALTLGDNLNSNGVTEDGAALSGSFDYVFNLVETSDLQIDLGYQMLTGASIADTDTLRLTVAIDGTDLETDTYSITGGGQDSGMNRLVIDVAALENGVTYAAGLHTLSLTATLTNSAVPENGASDEGTARLIIDNVAVTTDVSFDTDPTAWDNTGKSVGIGVGEGWSYQPATLNNDAANGIVNGWDDDPATVGNPFGSDGGALCMTLGDGATATVGDGAGTLDGYFSYFFTLEEGAYATLDMSYLLLTGATVPAGATLDLSVELVSLGFFADTEFQSDLGLHQVVASGGGVRGSAWQDMVDLELGGLDAGAYELRIHGYLSESSDTASSYGIVMVDDVELDITDGIGTWESTPSGGNNGGNNEVGPRNTNGVARYTDVFKANIHSELQDGGDQSYTIYDVQKEGEADLMVSFRYSFAETFDFGSGDVSIVAIDTATGEMTPLTDSTNSLENHMDDWWDGEDDDDPHYNWVRAKTEELGSGTYDIKIIFSDEATSSNFWIDDLSVIASQRSSTIRPQTILSSINTGQGGATRPFAMGVTNESPGLKIYAGEGMDEGADLISPYPDGTINAIDVFDLPELKSAHYSANVFELIDGTWQLFGTGISSDTNIDFLGVSASEPGAMYGMPGSELYQLTDLVIGPNQLIWAAVQHATTDFVDPVPDDNRDEKTQFDVHAFEQIEPPAYWNVANPGTDLDIQVWRWVANWDPGEVPVGTEAGWKVLDIGLPELYNAYTNIQMVVTPEGTPMIGWTNRDNGGDVWNSGVIRYEGEAGGVPVWGAMGDLGDIQNNDYWSSSFLYDMVVTPDGEPVVNYNMLHLESYGIREFISEANTPHMVISEYPAAGVDVISDNALHFGSTVNDKLFRSFIVENTGNADLVIFDISMDGFGDVSSDVFQLENFSQFPITLEPGDLKSVRVSFDPTVETVSPGIYDGVLLLQSNVPDNPVLPISQYYEMTLHTEVLDQSEVYVDPNKHQWLNFSKTLINGGVSDASGLFQKEFTVGSAREVNLQFDYRLLLAEQLLEGQTLELFITIDGERLTLSDPSAYEIVGGAGNVTGYLTSDTISLGELAAGKHLVQIGAEMATPTHSGLGGIGTLRLDNVVLNGMTYGFGNSPRQNDWLFQADTNNPQVTTGYWNDNVGTTGDGNGGLEMILGQEVQEIVVSNIGTEDMVIYEWMFEGVSFRTLTDTDGVSGAYISWTDTLGALKTEMIPSFNYYNTSDDVTLAPGRDLHLQVVFEPTEVVAYDETFYIHLSDSDEGVVPIRLSGMGLSGSDFLITAIYDGVNEISVSTDDTGEIDFGSVIKGQSEIVTVTIFNTGTSDLTIMELHSNGSTEITFDPSSILNEAIDPIVPGGAWSFNVIYTPAIGSVGDTTIDELLGEQLVIITDAPVLDLVVTTIELAGLGVPEIPVISLVDTTTGKPFAFNQVNFGTSHVGVPIEKTFNIENIGGAALTIDHIRLVGDDGAYFTFTPNDNGPNNPADDDVIPFKGNAIPVTVLFTPTNSEYYNDAQIQVFYMDENNILRKAQLDLVGRGTIQELEITDTQGAANDSLVDYGQVGLNRTSDSQTITLTNTGDGNWTINTISVVGGDVFSLVDDFSVVILTPGESYDFDVQFTPEAIASFTDSIKIESTDPDSASVDFFVTLLGLGVNPGELAIFNDAGEAITNIDFGQNLALQKRLYKSIEIRNNGEDGLRIEGIEVFPFTQNFSLSHTLDSADEEDYFDLLPGVPLPLTVSFISANFFDSSQATPPLVVRITTSDGSGDPQFTDVALIAKSIFVAESSNITWYDGTELVARIIVTGGGTAMVTPVSDSDFSIGSIQLSDTGSKTTLKVIGLADDVTVGNITGGAVKSVVLKNVSLNGDINLDGAVSLMLDDVIDGADIDIDQALGKPVKITAGDIADGTAINVAGSVTQIKADSYGAGQITAESIKTISIKGDFGASIDVDGELRTLNVKGQSVSGDINVGERFNKFNAQKAGFDGSITADSIGSITVDSLDNVLINTRSQLKKLMVMGNMSGSHVLAGLDLGDDNLLGGLGDNRDILNSSGDIRNVNVKGEVSGSYLMAGIAANSLGDFNVFEGDGPGEVRSGIIGTVRFGNFDSIFSTPYGVAGRDIGRVKVDGSTVAPGADLGNVFFVEEF
ncbi:MAG: choice-of-anchor D domain-containing protein [Phycisphaerae bacterium]|nr:choice-of-anchor D domain-containing protein [Phycisphaerae bacterium]